jgi:hypothetical protein
MRRTLISAAIGVLLSCVLFWSIDLFDNLRRAADVAALQAQASDEWLGLTEVTIADGSNRAGMVTEPVATWTVEPKRLLELRIAVSTRDIASGEPVCVGGTVTFILEPAVPMTFSRPLSRIAGVDHCDWPVGVYRSRFTWTMTDPASRVSKTLFQESDQFAVTK